MPKYIAQRELSASGGGSADTALANNLNPFKRKTDLPVVYWSGIVDSDNATRTLHYTVPDYFNGTLRIMAVAVANNAVGSTHKDGLVQGDFIINPNTPNLVSPGDNFLVTAAIANNMKDAADKSPTRVSLKVSPSLKIQGSATQQLLIPAGEERTVQFNVIAQPVLGNATLTFHVEKNKAQANYQATLSVRPTQPYQPTVQIGSSTAAKQTITIKRQLLPEPQQQQASFSTSPLLLIKGLQNYLKVYPYDCTEQVVSAASVQLAATEDQPATQLQLEKAMQLLVQRQNSDGSFNYWQQQNNAVTNPFISVYTIDFLTQAKLQGYNVPSYLFNHGVDYLRNLAKTDPTSPQQAQTVAYAIYILTRNEIVTSSYIANLQQYLSAENNSWQKELTAVYLAGAYQLLKNNQEAANLIKGYSLKTNAANAIGLFNNALADNAQYISILARHFPEQLKKLGDHPLMSLVHSLTDNNQLNTLSAAYAAAALQAYTQNLANDDKTLSINAVLADNKIIALTSLNARYPQVLFPNNTKQLLFLNPEQQRYFYQVQQSGFDRVPVTRASSKGIEVYRDYLGANNKIVNKILLGNTMQSHIQLRALDDLPHNNVAIVDLIPGGFDVVANSVQSANCSYVDIREDRVIFYCPASPSATILSYTLRAVNKGSYITPSTLAQDMYRQSAQSITAIGTITVE